MTLQTLSHHKPVSFVVTLVGHMVSTCIKDKQQELLLHILITKVNQ